MVPAGRGRGAHTWRAHTHTRAHQAPFTPRGGRARPRRPPPRARAAPPRPPHVPRGRRGPRPRCGRSPHSPLHAGPAPARRCHGDRGDTVSELGAFFSARRRGPPPRPARAPPRAATPPPRRRPSRENAGNASAPPRESGGLQQCPAAAGRVPGASGQSGSGWVPAQRRHRPRKAAAASGSAAASPLWVLPERARALLTARPKGSGSGCTICVGRILHPPSPVGVR